MNGLGLLTASQVRYYLYRHAVYTYAVPRDMYAFYDNSFVTMRRYQLPLRRSRASCMLKTGQFPAYIERRLMYKVV